jgi:hypothetical protein
LVKQARPANFLPSGSLSHVPWKWLTGGLVGLSAACAEKPATSKTNGNNALGFIAKLPQQDLDA